MKATDMLMEEHRVIEQMIGVLEAQAEAAREQGRLDAGAARAALAFIREYADGLHHRKEEDLLFKAMLDAGLPREHGPVAVMLADHDEGRSHAAAMAASLEGAVRGEPEALERFARAALGYGGLLRQHIFKEDNILYAMAERMLPPAVQEGLRESFRGVDETGAAVKRRHEASAEELGRRCGVERERTRPRPAGAGGPFCH